MRRGLVVALSVVAAVNLGVALDVFRDRAGEAVSAITLDERELVLERPTREGGVTTLRWRFQPEGWPDAGAPCCPPPRIDQRALEALGFDCSVPPGAPGATEHYRGVLPRRAILVFELGGPEWRSRLETWQQRSRDELVRLLSAGSLTAGEETARREAIDRAAERVSRLVLVDLGPDVEPLRIRHADRSRYLLLPGLVRLRHRDGAGGGGPLLSGSVVEVFPAELSVPKASAPALAGLGPTVAPRPPDRQRVEQIGHAPRYTVHVETGRLLHPSVASVARTGPAQ
jgi:hypothetical protein